MCLLQSSKYKAKLNYFWRLLATGWCFATFGLGGLVLTVTVLPIINRSSGDLQIRKERTQKVIHLCFKIFVAQMKLLGIMSVEVQGAERLDKPEGMIIVANHPSLIDVVVVLSLLPKIDCVVKRQLWENPFMRNVVEDAKYIDNSDPEKLVDECVKRIRERNSLLIFPEGSRSVPGKPLKFRRGAAIAAILAQKPILPIIITVNPTTLTKAEKWYQIPGRKFCCRIFVRTPIDTEPFFNGRQTVKLSARKLNRYLEEYYSRFLALL